MTIIDEAAMTGRWRTRIELVRPGLFKRKQPLLVLQVEWRGVRRHLNTSWRPRSNAIDENKRNVETWWTDATPNDQMELGRRIGCNAQAPPLEPVAA